MVSKKKNSILGLILIVAVAVVGSYWVYSQYASNEEIIVEQEWDEDVSTLGGVIAFAEGAVEYKSGEGAWTRALNGVNLEEGDSIEIVGVGKAIINLDDGSVLRLNDDSGVTLTSMDPNHMIITNDGGRLYSRVIKSDRVFEVVAGDIVYESMGTAYVTSHKDSKKGVEVFESQVRVRTREGEEMVGEGQFYYVEHDGEVAVKTVADFEETILKDDFIAWNKAEDEVNFKYELGYFTDKEDEDREESGSTMTGIQLTYNKNGNVNWIATGESPKGYKLVWSKTSGATYPTRSGDEYKYYSDPTTRTGAVYAFDGGGTYYIRVCEYIDGECGLYSNEVTATFYGEDDKEKETKTTEAPSNTVSSILLSANGTSVNWNVEGYSEKGYKIIWSKNTGPTYPTRSGDKYQYLSSPSATSTSLTAFNGGGIYHVRVCEYLGGACGVYSNEIQIELQ